MTANSASRAGRAPAVALTIAGSDSSGGAGIQADLKTFTVHEVYGASVITALTAQNTKGVLGIHPVPAEFVALQLDAVLADLDVKAAKTGMLSDAAVIEVIANKLGSNFSGWLVVDPVMVSTSGDRLIEPSAIDVLIKRLIPLATLITPNIAEAAVLCGRDEAGSIAEMEEQARRLLEFGTTGVLVKGGHGDAQEAIDVLATPDGIRRFVSPRIATPHTHGSGCTLSAAITAQLALGAELEEAIQRAKDFVQSAIESAATRPVGSGRAPLDHLVTIAGKAD